MGGPATAYSVALFVLMTVDLVAVRALLKSYESAGFYAAALTIGRLIFFFFHVVGLVLLPSVSTALAQDDQRGAAKHVSEGIRLLLLAMSPAAVLLSAGAKFVIMVLFSSQYAGAVEPLRWLPFSFAFWAAFTVLANVFIAGRKLASLLKITVPLIPLDILLNIVLVPRYGLAGAAAATTITAGLGFAMVLIYVVRWLGMPRSLGWSAAKVAMLCAALYVLARLLPAHAGWAIPGFVGLAALYGVALLLLGEVRLQEIRRALSMLGVAK